MAFEVQADNPTEERATTPEGYFRCVVCGARYPVVSGIARLITADDLARHAPFLTHYQRVRAAEGWTADPEVLRTLPYVPSDAPHAPVWQRRVHSYQRLLAIMSMRWPARSLDILDLGAGNCWLGARLAGLGHRVEALDINVNGADGLGAAAHLDGSEVAARITRVQASFDRLPYCDAQFDLVVAAASLHYARGLASVIVDVARVLRAGGALILLDTPIYIQARAGREAAEERLAEQRRCHGSDGTGTAGPGYIVRAPLRRYMRRAGLSYREVQVNGRGRSALGTIRRAGRALLGRPERAQMPLVVGDKR